MTTISLCLIVKNEEENLASFLEHHRSFVDEMIIVDTGSTDKTKAIATSWGCRVFSFDLTGKGLADARNFSLDQASKEWILVLDPDERIAGKDLEKMRQLTEQQEFQGFYFIQRNYTPNKGGYIDWVSSQADSYKESAIAPGWSPNPIIRFFKNDRRIRFAGFCHEVVDESIEKIGTVGEVAIPIHHHGLLNREKYGKAERNIGLLQKDLDDGIKEKYFTYFQLAVTLLDKDDLQSAEEALRRSIGENPNYAPSLSRLACLCLLKDNGKEAEELLFKALKVEPSADIYNNLGVLFSRKKEYQRAVNYFREAILLSPRNSDSYVNLSLLFEEVGEKEKADYFLGKAKELNPGI